MTAQSDGFDAQYIYKGICSQFYCFADALFLLPSGAFKVLCLCHPRRTIVRLPVSNPTNPPDSVPFPEAQRGRVQNCCAQITVFDAQYNITESATLFFLWQIYFFSVTQKLSMVLVVRRFGVLMYALPPPKNTNPAISVTFPEAQRGCVRS